MPEYADIYVISQKRDEATIFGFLNLFLPARKEYTDEYEIPQYSDSPVLMFDTAKKLIEYCCVNKSEAHTIYWNALEEKKPEHGMVFFLSDGNVIYGLSNDARNRALTKKLLDKAKDYLGSDLGYVGHEASPDCDDFDSFVEQTKIHSALWESGVI